MSKKQPSQRPQTKATRQDWINTALETLICEGIDQVKILLLAKKLGVSRASFYWYFNDRKVLENELLQYWRRTNTRAIINQAAIPSGSIIEAAINVSVCWFDETLYNPGLDSAIRAWAHQDDKVRRIVDNEDDTRVAAIKDMFLRHGHEDTDAFIRARIFYFTQIGYYALEIQESNETRLSYFEHYLYSFTGVKPTKKQMAQAVEFINSSVSGKR